MTFQEGEPVRITFRGKTVSGAVLLSSANGLSLTLQLDEYLGSYMKFMPLLWLDGGYVDLVQAEPVDVLRLQRV